MKKLLFPFLLVVLLAAGCNSMQQLFLNKAVVSPTQQQQTKNYVDKQYNFTIILPDGFYMNKGVENGIYTYTKIFSTQPGDNPQADSKDITLEIQISHANGQGGMYTSLADATNNLLVLTKSDNNVKISLNKSLSVDGLPAVQQLEDFTKAKDGDNDCVLETFFQQGKEVHNISAIANSCETLIAFKPPYDSLISSFRFISNTAQSSSLKTYTNSP